MLGRRHERDEVVTRDDAPVRDDERHDRTDRRPGGPPLVRALFTLAGVAIAGFLIWLASLFNLDQTGEFWAAMGLVAAAGLTLALSQLFGGWTKWGLPTLSPGVFLLAFIPALVVVGWILLANQPEGGWQQARFENWSGDLGISGLIGDLAEFVGPLAMGLGLVLGFTFDTRGPRTREIVERDRDVVPDEDVHDFTTTTAPADEQTVVRDDRASVPVGERPDRVEIHDPERRDAR